MIFKKRDIIKIYYNFHRFVSLHQHATKKIYNIIKFHFLPVTLHIETEPNTFIVKTTYFKHIRGERSKRTKYLKLNLFL